MEKPKAGAAFLAASQDDPSHQDAIRRTQSQLRAFARHLRMLNEALTDARRDWDKAHKQKMGKLWRKARAEQAAIDAELAAAGYGRPGDDLAAWEQIAMIAERDPNGLSLDEIRKWALAAAKRRELDAAAIAVRVGPASKTKGKGGRPAHTEPAAKFAQARREREPPMKWDDIALEWQLAHPADTDKDGEWFRNAVRRMDERERAK